MGLSHKMGVTLLFVHLVEQYSSYMHILQAKLLLIPFFILTLYRMGYVEIVSLSLRILELHGV